MRTKDKNYLDTLIAEKVMEWASAEFPYQSIWVKLPGDKTATSSDFVTKEAFRPSTDIADALEVAKKMGEWSMCFDGMQSYGVLFGNDVDQKRVGWTYSEELSKAICLAALRALGISVEENKDAKTI